MPCDTYTHLLIHLMWNEKTPRLQWHPTATRKLQWHLLRKVKSKTSKKTKTLELQWYTTSTLIQVKLIFYDVYMFIYIYRLFPVYIPIITSQYSCSSAKHYRAVQSCCWLNNWKKKIFSIFSRNIFFLI